MNPHDANQLEMTRHANISGKLVTNTWIYNHNDCIVCIQCRFLLNLFADLYSTAVPCHVQKICFNTFHYTKILPISRTD